MRIREFLPSDYDAVRALWERCDLTLSLSDEREEVERMLRRNPGTCLVAEEDGAVIGAVMGGWDGRRGFVHHLAVEPGRRRRGVGRALMAELERRFRDMGVVKITFFIERRNRGVTEFYRRLGYEMRDDIRPMSKTLREGP